MLLTSTTVGISIFRQDGSREVKYQQTIPGKIVGILAK
jgi:hypothetical protein